MEDIQQLYEQHFKMVYKYLLSISRNTHIAEELTQETFFKAIQKVKAYRGECKIEVWLCQIAKNLYYDYLRRRKKLVPQAEQEAEDYSALNFQNDILDKDTALQIHRILHNLGEPYKEIFSLRIFGELSFAEISSLFGKSESWARVTYHRACKKIREELNHEDNM